MSHVDHAYGVTSTLLLGGPLDGNWWDWPSDPGAPVTYLRPQSKPFDVCLSEFHGTATGEIKRPKFHYDTYRLAKLQPLAGSVVWVHYHESIRPEDYVKRFGQWYRETYPEKFL